MVSWLIGMNFLVGVLIYLIYTEHINGKGERHTDIESEVFWMFVAIMQEKEWRMLYLNDMPKLQKLLDKLDLKIQHKLPDLYSLITQHVLL